MVTFDKVLASVRLVNLRGGIFGKTTALLIVLCICVASVSMKASVWWMPLALILPLMALVTYALRRVFDFAEKHPQAAIMEGAELLIHERTVHARKGVEQLPPIEPSVDHEMPLMIGSETQADPPLLPALGDDAPKSEKGG